MPNWGITPLCLWAHAGNRIVDYWNHAQHLLPACGSVVMLKPRIFCMIFVANVMAMMMTLFKCKNLPSATTLTQTWAVSARIDISAIISEKTAMEDQAPMIAQGGVIARNGRTGGRGVQLFNATRPSSTNRCSQIQLSMMCCTLWCYFCICPGGYQGVRASCR